MNQAFCPRNIANFSTQQPDNKIYKMDFDTTEPQSPPPLPPSPPTPFKTIEYRCQAMKKSMGVFDHYFLVIDDKEYHAGFYKPGRVLPVNSTKGYHICMVSEICEVCYVKIVADYRLEEDVRIFSYFPMLNCETLCFGFSLQSLTLLALPFIVVLLFKGKFILSIIVLMVVLLLLLVHSKYTFSRCKRTQCPHLRKQQQQHHMKTK